jgi:hypothetical protein
MKKRKTGAHSTSAFYMHTLYFSYCKQRKMKSLLIVLGLLAPLLSSAFLPVSLTSQPAYIAQYAKANQRKPGEKIISNQRRQQLGIPDNEDEYDLDKALENNTDPLISKIIAGSLIITILGLLVVGVIIPSLTDYGEGVCSPIQNGGRC